MRTVRLGTSATCGYARERLERRYPRGRGEEKSEPRRASRELRAIRKSGARRAPVSSDSATLLSARRFRLVVFGSSFSARRFRLVVFGSLFSSGPFRLLLFFSLFSCLPFPLS